MILVDLQQTAIAWFSIDQKKKLDRAIKPTFFDEDGFGEEDLPDLDRMRNGLLRSLLYIRRQFAQDFGNFVLCCDSKNSWRRDIFPFYKAKRRENRKEGPIDFKTFHENFTVIKEEFATHLPYRLVEADGAEGDDVIAVMCEWNAGKKSPEPVLIHSSDQDFLQLQKYPQVQQWDKFRERWLKCDFPSFDVQELIIRGDDKDGVPNILSEDNCFVAGIRQRPMMKAKVDVWRAMDPATIDWDDITRERYERNKRLVDLSMIPSDVKARIAIAYLDAKPGQRGQLHNYLAKTPLLSSAGDF